MTRLVILSILQRRPMHGYEIQQIIQEEEMEQWVNVLSGSIYFALNQMEKEGLIRADAEERTGNRLRKIYAITDRGRHVYLDLLRAAMLAPPHSLKSDFSFALGSAQFLDAQERESLLRQNMQRLEEIQQFWQRGLAIKSNHHPAIKALLKNDLEMIQNDLQFLRNLLIINKEEVDSKDKSKPVQATHLMIRTTGSYRQNSFTYEETVPIGEHENSQWWVWFHSSRAATLFNQVAVSQVTEGQIFKFNDRKSKTFTEIVAIVKK